MASSPPLEAGFTVPTSSGPPRAAGIASGDARPEEDDISVFNSPTGLEPMVLLNAAIE